jgi:HNH endonuclease
MPKIARPVEERLWEKVNKNAPNGCWEWTASCDSSGYGHLRITKPKVGFIRPHRWVLEQQGIDLTGLEVLHKCDNPKCCNPDHLTAGTHSENLKDMFNKNRHPANRGYKWWNNKIKTTMAKSCPGPGWSLGRL